MLSEKASRMITRSIRTLSQLRTYVVARSPMGLGEANQAPFSRADLPNPIVAA
jgi:hypothetical protein